MQRLCLAFVALAALASFRSSMGQTVVNSTYAGGAYSDPNSWKPAEVPNNTATTRYNIIIPSTLGTELNANIDATISNLTFGRGIELGGNVLTVLGTTAPETDFSSLSVSNSAFSPARLNAGTLAIFSGGVLRGSISIGGDVAFQFDGARISTISQGSLGLSGPLARVVDENGADALTSLGLIENGGRLFLFDHSLTTGAVFTNNGWLSLGRSSVPTSFTASASLTNFDPSTHTLTGGQFTIYNDPPSRTDAISTALLRFPGADIVRNAASLSLYGAGAAVVDLSGNDGLRNFSHNLASGSFALDTHDFVTAGDFTNDGILTLANTTFAISGSFTNYGATAHTLTGGVYHIDRSTLKFPAADLIHNAATFDLSNGGMFSDPAGNDGLRNFRDNLSGGSFTVGHGQTFSVAGDFSNAGLVGTASRIFSIRQYSDLGTLVIASGFAYTQTSGLTANNGVLKADRVQILGGTFKGAGAVNGNMSVSNAIFIPSYNQQINGALTLGAGAKYHVDGFPFMKVTGAVMLGGNLEVNIPYNGGFGRQAGFTLLHSDAAITGMFSNAPNGARLLTSDGTGSFVVLYDQKVVLINNYHAEPPPSQLLNISTRAALSRAADDPDGTRSVMIGGFIISGIQPKRIVVRGLGPSLAAAAVSMPLPDPVLELHYSNGSIVATNDNWKDSQQNEIAADNLAPTDDRESAIAATLNPGAYTVILKEKNGAAGNALVEAYDLSGTDSSKLVNISTRAYVDADSALIGGIIAAGDGNANDDIVVRAIGPQLRTSGIAHALDDPAVELRNANGALVIMNDDWSVNFDQIPDQLKPQFAQEAALRVNVPRGNYTAIVRSKGSNAGVALVEIYDLHR